MTFALRRMLRACAFAAGVLTSSIFGQAAFACDASNTSGNGGGVAVGSFDQGNFGSGGGSNAANYLDTQGLTGVSRVDKVDQLAGGGCATGGSGVVDAIALTATSGTWNSHGAPICAVGVHAGNGTTAFFYKYVPAVTSGTWSTAAAGNKTISNLQFFACSGTGQQTGTVNLIKVTQDGGTGLSSFASSSFALQLTPSGGQTTTKAVSFTAFGTSATQTLSSLAAGVSYTFGEGAMPTLQGYQWQQVSLVCKDSGGNDVGTTFTLQANQNVTCTATNKLVQQTGTVNLIKVTQDGGTGLSSFASSSFALQLTPSGGQMTTKTTSFTAFGQSATQTLSSLTAGVSYTFGEGAMPTLQGYKWQQVSLVCKDSTNTDVGTTFTLQANQNVTCTATNKLVVLQTGSIKVIKTAIGANGETFNFSVAKGGSVVPGGTFSLGNGGSTTLTGLELTSQTSYSITESSLPSGDWYLKDVSCTGTDASSNLTTDLASKKVTFNLSSTAKDVVCTFTNAKRGSITIVKAVTGGSNVSFPFQWTATNGQSLSNFSLQPSGGSDSKTFTALPAGSYTVKEGAVAGWKLTSVTCDQGGSGDKANSLATINVADGQSTTCTFTNEQQKGTLKVVKTTIGGDGTFSFTAANNSFTLKNGGQQSFTLPVGDYTVSENNIPDGWTLQGASCDKGGSLNGTSIKATVTADATTTCTFTNFKKKDDKMGDVTKLFIHRRVDNLLSNEPDRAHIIRRLDGAPAPSLKDGGSYSGASDGWYGTGVPGSLKDPARSDMLKLQGRTESAGADSIGDRKFSASLSQMQADAAARDREKAAEAGFNYAGYNTAILQPRFDLWVEGHLAGYTDTLGGINREGDFKVLYVGGDYVIRPGLLIGALVQIDQTNEDIKNPDLWGKVSGTGWMAGPYMGAKLAEHLYFDARAAWGQSSNDIWLYDSAAGRRSGSFDTDRWLATATLTGNYQFGAFRVSPQLGLAYGSENADAYRNSLGQIVDKSSATIGRLTFGPEFGYATYIGNGIMLEPQFSVKGIWDFDDDPIKLSTGTVQADELRAQIEAGVMIKMPSGYAFRAAGSYDGVGDKNLEVWTAKAWVNVPLD